MSQVVDLVESTETKRWPWLLFIAIIAIIVVSNNPFIPFAIAVISRIVTQIIPVITILQSISFIFLFIYITYS